MPRLPPHLPVILLAIAAPLLCATRAVAQGLPAAAGEDLEFSVLTFGPGDEIWEPFGHIGLRARDRRSGLDVVFNWGVFSFDQPGFLGRFLRGQMQYSLGLNTTGSTLRLYRSLDRTIDEQQLALEPAEKAMLWQLLSDNVRSPEYRYDYYLDNCSTRVRDLLDAVTGGQIEETLGGRPGHSFRFHSRRLTQPVSPIFEGLDVLMAGRTDDPRNAWEDAWVPLELRDDLDVVQIERNGLTTPLVSERMRLFEAERAPPGQRPRFLVWKHAIAAWLAAALLFWAGRGNALPRRLLAAMLAVGWSALAGILGLVQSLLMLTDHVFGHWNENLAQLSPLSLLLAPLAGWALLRGRTHRWTQRLATVLLCLSAAGTLLQILPWLDQTNGSIIAMALPLHLALFLSLKDAEDPQQSSERENVSAR
ncbi:MAG: DUF4105 domain-containing protein [Acidobacteriota bacterium]